MKVVVLKQAERELKSAPHDIKIDVFSFYVIHATAKKKMALDRQTADLLKQRIRSLDL